MGKASWSWGLVHHYHGWSRWERRGRCNVGAVPMCSLVWLFQSQCPCSCKLYHKRKKKESTKCLDIKVYFVWPQLQLWYLEMIQSSFRVLGLWIGQITEWQKRAEFKYRTVRYNLNSLKNTRENVKVNSHKYLKATKKLPSVTGLHVFLNTKYLKAL